MKFSFSAKLLAVAVGASLLAACSSGSGTSSTPSTNPNEKVELAFWTWVPNIDKVVSLWNTAHPNIHVTASNQAQGDEEVTKVLTAAKAGNAPDLFQAEYQALPTLVSNDVAADIKAQTTDVKSHFADGVFFALLFALLFHPLVPLRNTMLGNLIKALLYGTVLAVISAAWWVPAVYVPHHAGFLSTSLGWKLTFGIFLWHWIYGYFLGTVYCPSPQGEAVPAADPCSSRSPEHALPITFPISLTDVAPIRLITSSR